MDFVELENHLFASKEKFDLLKIYDKSGYTPIHYAAYKNIEKACEILIQFVLAEDEEELDTALNGGGGSGDTSDLRHEREKMRK